MEEKQVGGVSVGGAVSAEAPKVKAEKKVWQKWYFWVILVLALGMLMEAGGIVYFLTRGEETSEVAGNEQGDVDKSEGDGNGEADGGSEGDLAENGSAGDDSAETGLSGNASSGSVGKEGTAQYIYVGEWRKKFRIPEGLIRVVYKFNRYDDYQETLCVSGMPKGATGNPEFATDLDPGLGCLTRISEEARGKEGYGYLDEWGVEFDSDGYMYRREGPQAVLSTDERERDWEVQTVNMIQELLSSGSEF